MAVGDAVDSWVGGGKVADPWLGDTGRRQTPGCGGWKAADPWLGGGRPWGGRRQTGGGGGKPLGAKDTWVAGGDAVDSSVAGGGAADSWMVGGEAADPRLAGGKRTPRGAGRRGSTVCLVVYVAC